MSGSDWLQWGVLKGGKKYAMSVQNPNGVVPKPLPNPLPNPLPAARAPADEDWIRWKAGVYLSVHIPAIRGCRNLRGWRNW